MSKYNKLIFLTIPVFVYLLFIIFSDGEQILKNLFQIKTEFFLLFVGFWSLGVVFRVIRWHIFMNNITTKIPFRRNTIYFLSGFSMLLTPGRMGEIIRSPFIKRDYDIPVTKTATIVFVERFYDLLAVIIIVAFALTFVNLPKTLLLVPIAIISIMIILIVNKQLLLKFMMKLNSIKILNNKVPNVEESFELISKLLKSKNLVIGLSTTLGVVIVEAIGVFFLLKSFDTTLDFLTLTAIFHISNFIAAASMIPGGLGVLEGGFSGLLILYEIPNTIAISAAVLLRIIATGLFSIIGLVCLKFLSKPHFSD